jgi:hypothetical protein
MGSKSTLAVLVTVLATILWAALRDTYVAVAVETATEHAAKWIGIPRADMIAGLTPYLLAIAASFVVALVSYNLGIRDQTLKPTFKFIYDTKDNRFVRRDEQKISYFVGLRVVSKTTVEFPNVRILEGRFTSRKIAHDKGFDNHRFGPIQLYSGGALDPDDLELVFLCELPPERKYLIIESPDDPLDSLQKFTLEARGRHAKTVRAIFQYDPNADPMIRMVS